MRFRTNWIGIVAVCLLMSWVLRVIKPAGLWRNITGALGVVHPGEYDTLMCLGLAITGFLAVLRVLRFGRDDESGND